MKLLGAILILTAGILGGILLLLDKKKRRDDYWSLAAALELLRGELSSEAVPLALGIERANAHTKGMGKELLSAVSSGLDELGERSFGEIWDKALAETCSWLAAEPASEIRKLGAELGRFDLEVQLRSLDACALYLKEQWRRQKNAYPAERRVALGLSFCFTALLVILLY